MPKRRIPSINHPRDVLHNNISWMKRIFNYLIMVIEIFYNLCEVNIKLFATVRPAWLLADTPKGARAIVVLYAIVESVGVNALEVYEFLKYLLEEMLNDDHL